MKKLFTVIFILFSGFGFYARADEGMWLLPLIEKLNMGKMTELGLKLSSEDIYSLNKASLKDAIVIFDNGCTGEMVSSKGLLLTNYHCGYESVQGQSSVGKDYLRTGFWAMSEEEELPDPGLSVTFLKRIEDVTDQVLSDVKQGMDENERISSINRNINNIRKRAGEGNNYRVQVTDFYGGRNYYLIVYEIYTDVRLVGAPPSSIGKFGAESDNWEWPRHTGDFSLFRVYSGPDGKPADYSDRNIPLKPLHYLPVSVKDINTGDFAMIMGYPGTTNRYMTSYEINELLQITHPGRIKIRGLKQDIWMEEMKADEKVNIQYSSKYYESSNYWKYSIGQKSGLEKLNVKAKKEEIENKFKMWVAASPDRNSKYGVALSLIMNSIDDRADLYNAQLYLSECLQGCEILDMEQLASILIKVLKSGDTIRINGIISMVRSLAGDLYKDINPDVDRKTMKVMLMLYRSDVPEKYHPDFFRNVIDKKFSGDIARFVDNMFSRSIFGSEEKLISFLDKPSIKVLENDPVCQTAESFNTVISEVSSGIRRFDPSLSRGRRLWISALTEMSPEITQYPDANFTMRLSYGSVQGYDPKRWSVI